MLWPMLWCWEVGVATSAMAAIFLAYVIKKFVDRSGYTDSESPNLLKYLLALRSMRSERNKSIRRCHDYVPDVTQGLEKYGFVAPKREWALEMPSKTPEQEWSEESVSFSGFNRGGEQLLCRVTRRADHTCDAEFHLTTTEGTTYTTSVMMTSSQVNQWWSDGGVFHGGGLTLQCLAPMRRWRVHYNGLLSKNGDPEDEGIHVKFSCLWQTVSPPFDFQQDFDESSLATALSHSQWQDIKPNLELFLGQQDQYDQWGQFMGTVVIDGQAEKEIYMWGLKNRKRPGSVNIPGTRELYGYLHDGFAFRLQTFKPFPDQPSLTVGYVFYPKRKCYPVRKCTTQTTGESLKVTFNTELQEHVLECVPGSGASSECTSVWGPQKERITKRKWAAATLDGFKGTAVAVAETKNKDTPLKELPKQVLLLESDEEPKSGTPGIVHLDHPVCRSPHVVGGKAVSLHLLHKLSTTSKDTKNKFSVPRAVVLTVAAYREHLELNPQLKDLLSNLSKQVASCSDPTKMKIYCEHVVRQFSSSSISGDVIQILEHHLTVTFGTKWEETPLSVRSSAAGEDSADMSAAGQMDTFLGVRGKSELLKSICKCWASQFSLTAVQYKRQNGQVLDSGMGVVIQEMVNAETAGVMFTCDPVTGNPQYINITANYGLGESVVSASADPDVFVVKRNLQGKLTLHSATIGRKENQIVMAESGGTKNVVTSSVKEAESGCVTEEGALLLAGIGVEVESAFASLRDIEWALDGSGNVYLLQARPVTTHLTMTDFEIVHEFDSGVLTDFEFTSKCNTGEVMPGAMSPLTLSSLVHMLSLCVQGTSADVEGLESPKYHPQFLTNLICHRSQVIFCLIDSMPAIESKAGSKESILSRGWEIALFGRLLEEYKDIKKHSILRHGSVGAKQQKKRIKFFIKCCWSLVKNLKKVAAMLEGPHPGEQVQDSKGIYQDIQRKILGPNSEAIKRHIEASSTSMTANMFLLGVLCGKDQSWRTELFADFALMLSNCQNVESADVPASLKDLATAILRELGTGFCDLDPKQALKNLQMDPGLVGTKYQNFIRQHGHRCWKEFDLNSITWDMDPLKLMTCLQSMVKSLANMKNPVNSKTTEDIFSQLKSPITKKQKFILTYLMKLAQWGVRTRETSKSLLIKANHVCRRAFLHLSEAMVREGRIPDQRLIFFLTFEEIGELLQNRSATILAKAQRRRRLYPQLDEFDFPEVGQGVPIKFVQELEDKQEENYESLQEIRGTPVCQGTVKATARVVMKLEDAVQIQPGDVLITHSTDVGWTPYFPLLGGVVTELGGLISHGAVVAREYGLPCIVGARGATAIFKSGDQVILDGKEGILKKIK